MYDYNEFSHNIVFFCTATYGSDYVLESNILTFVSGQTYEHNNRQCANITILDDSVLETNESFMLWLNTAYPVLSGAISNMTIIITDDSQDCKLCLPSFELQLAVQLIYSMYLSILIYINGHDMT